MPALIAGTQAQARPRRAPATCSTCSASATRPSRRPARCRVASASGWRSPGRSPTSRRCCSPTSRPARSTSEGGEEVLELFRRLHQRRPDDPARHPRPAGRRRRRADRAHEGRARGRRRPWHRRASDARPPTSTVNADVAGRCAARAGCRPAGRLPASTAIAGRARQLPPAPPWPPLASPAATPSPAIVGASPCLACAWAVAGRPCVAGAASVCPVAGVVGSRSASPSAPAPLAWSIERHRAARREPASALADLVQRAAPWPPCRRWCSTCCSRCPTARSPGRRTGAAVVAGYVVSRCRPARR